VGRKTVISVVFSKDRAFQLDAFLRSYRDHVLPLNLVYVLYLATDDRHRAAYHQVFASHPHAIPLTQTSFKTDLLAMLPATGHVVFFVDDQIFTRAWDVEAIPGLSLRLGLNLAHCYPLNVAQQVPPVELEQGFVTWRWIDGEATGVTHCRLTVRSMIWRVFVH
jgi:hypothetical protein